MRQTKSAFWPFLLFTASAAASTVLLLMKLQLLLNLLLLMLLKLLQGSGIRTQDSATADRCATRTLPLPV